MSPTTSTARWREPIVPADYDDVSALVGLARKVRDRKVEFDWTFSRDDLLGLRRAVYEWGSAVRGVFRCFDARVLEAVNEALDDEASIFSLTEPKGVNEADQFVACAAEGERFRLHGQARFDVVFGYGDSGAKRDGDGSRGTPFLTPAAKAALTASVVALGWDIQRLQEARFIPIRNALYGFPVQQGAEEVPPHPGPEVRVEVTFKGPFAALRGLGCPCIFDDESVAATHGVYLQTVLVGGRELPWYVGQTRRGFGQRTAEHLANMLSGQYEVWDPEALAKGEIRRAAGAPEVDWARSLPDFLLGLEALMRPIRDTVRVMRFHVASLPDDALLLDRVEGAIGRFFKSHPVPAVLGFFAPGLRVPALVPGAQPTRLVLSTEKPIVGLPLEILEPSRPFSAEVRRFVESTTWTFAKTYAQTWPHEYVVKTAENAPQILALAKHVFEQGVTARFYAEERRYFRENGKVYWSMDPSPEATDLINRCDAAQTYEARLAAGTLPTKG